MDLRTVPSIQSLEFLVHEIQRRGTQVLLVNMPLHPLLNEAVPGGQRRCLLSYLQTLASPSVTIVDYQDKLPADHFIDLVHVNAKGREVFTHAIAEYLSKAEVASARFRATQSISQESLHAFQ